jgi:hypothetical protein
LPPAFVAAKLLRLAANRALVADLAEIARQTGASIQA